MFFGQNLKFLRKRKRMSQAEVAADLDIPRSSYSGYENQTVQPQFIMLLKISDYYKVSIDILIKDDLAKLTNDQLLKFEQNSDILKGTIFDRAVATDDIIEIVSFNSNYVENSTNQQYLNKLPTLNIPFLPKNIKHRAFYLSVNAPNNNSEKFIVICEYIIDWKTIKDGSNCVVVTKDGNIVLNQIFNMLQQNQSFMLCSANIKTEPRFVQLSKISEIWKQVAYVSFNSIEINQSKDAYSEAINKLQQQMAVLTVKAE